MWNTNQSKVVTSAFIGALVFSTNSYVGENRLDELLNLDNEASNLTGDHWTSVNVNTNHDGNEAVVTGIADIISLVKITLGLPNKDIAQIFGVTRPTLHAYTKNADTNHSIREHTIERSYILKEIANEISKKFRRSPGAMAKNYTVQGESLLGLLSEEELDIPKVIEFASLLSTELSKRSKQGSSMSDNISLYDLTRST